MPGFCALYKCAKNSVGSVPNPLNMKVLMQEFLLTKMGFDFLNQSKLYSCFVNKCHLQHKKN